MKSVFDVRASKRYDTSMDRNGKRMIQNDQVQEDAFVNIEKITQGKNLTDTEPVSYTHLDVYKRQAQQGVILIEIIGLKITVCIILGRVHDRLPLCFQRRLPNSSIIHPLSKRRQEPFSQKTGQRIRRNAAFAGKSLTGLLLDCTRFLSVVYCFCYGKVPVRCAGHSKEEKGNER